MVAGDARVGDNQILINLASDGERSMVEIDGALIVPLHEDQRGENSRPWRRDRTRDGLKSHAELPYSSSILKNANDRTAGPTRPDAGDKVTGSSCPAAQGGERLLLRVKNLENRCQLGNLQHVAQTLAQASEFDIGAGRPRGRIDAHQRPQSAAINIGHVGKIQDQSRGRLESVFEAIP